MKNIRFASSPWGFRETPLIEQCKWLDKMGFRHFCGQCGKDMRGLFPQDMSATQIEQARQVLKDYGLGCASFNGDGDFMVKKDVEEQVDLCCKRIDLATHFDPEVIIVFAGWQPREDDAIYGRCHQP
jgi:sugar phosphate isomerase/epimerase